MQIDSSGAGLGGARVSRTKASPVRRHRSMAASLSSRGNTGGGASKMAVMSIPAVPRERSAAMACMIGGRAGPKSKWPCSGGTRCELSCAASGDLVDAAVRRDGMDGAVAERDSGSDCRRDDGGRGCFGRAVAGGQVYCERAGRFARLELRGHPGYWHRVRTVRRDAHNLVVPRTERAVQGEAMPRVGEAGCGGASDQDL